MYNSSDVSTPEKTDINIKKYANQFMCSSRHNMHLHTPSHSNKGFLNA